MEHWALVGALGLGGSIGHQQKRSSIFTRKIY